MLLVLSAMVWAPVMCLGMWIIGAYSHLVCYCVMTMLIFPGIISANKTSVHAWRLRSEWKKLAFSVMDFLVCVFTAMITQAVCKCAFGLVVGVYGGAIGFYTYLLMQQCWSCYRNIELAWALGRQLRVVKQSVQIIQLQWKKNKFRSALQVHMQAKLRNATPLVSSADGYKTQHLIVRGWRWHSIGLPAAPSDSVLPLLVQQMEKYFTNHQLYVSDFALLSMQKSQAAFMAHLQSNQHQYPLQQANTQEVLQSNRGKELAAHMIEKPALKDLFDSLIQLYHGVRMWVSSVLDKELGDLQVCTEEESLFPIFKHGANYIGVLWHATKDESVEGICCNGLDVLKDKSKTPLYTQSNMRLRLSNKERPGIYTTPYPRKAYQYGRNFVLSLVNLGANMHISYAKAVDKNTVSNAPTNDWDSLVAFPKLAYTNTTDHPLAVEFVTYNNATVLPIACVRVSNEKTDAGLNWCGFFSPKMSSQRFSPDCNTMHQGDVVFTKTQKGV